MNGRRETAHACTTTRIYSKWPNRWISYYIYGTDMNGMYIFIMLYTNILCIHRSHLVCQHFNGYHTLLLLLWDHDSPPPPLEKEKKSIHTQPIKLINWFDFIVPSYIKRKAITIIFFNLIGWIWVGSVELIDKETIYLSIWFGLVWFLVFKYSVNINFINNIICIYLNCYVYSAVVNELMC